MDKPGANLEEIGAIVGEKIAKMMYTKLRGMPEPVIKIAQDLSTRVIPFSTQGIHNGMVFFMTAVGLTLDLMLQIAAELPAQMSSKDEREYAEKSHVDLKKAVSAFGSVARKLGSHEHRNGAVLTVDEWRVLSDALKFAGKQRYTDDMLLREVPLVRDALVIVARENKD